MLRYELEELRFEELDERNELDDEERFDELDDDLLEVDTDEPTVALLDVPRRVDVEPPVIDVPFEFEEPVVIELPRLVDEEPDWRKLLDEPLLLFDDELDELEEPIERLLFTVVSLRV